MDKDTEIKLNSVFKYFDRWTESIGLPNDIKPLKDITSEEYKQGLYNFYQTLNEDRNFREWICSFYGKNEIDFDYIYLMNWKEWFKLYMKIFSKYVDENIISF